MGHVKGITNLGVDKNPEYMEPWLRAIGSCMLNFGAIELMSYKYLDYLEETEIDFLQNINKLLSPRISRIEDLVQQKEIKNRDEVIDLWGKVRELAKWRNRIAHNPVLPTWKPGSDSGNSPPDLLGIPDMKQINKKSRITDSISLRRLNKLNDAIAEIAEKLHELSETMKHS